MTPGVVAMLRRLGPFVVGCSLALAGCGNTRIPVSLVPVTLPDAAEQQAWVADRNMIDRVFVNVSGAESYSHVLNNSAHDTFPNGFNDKYDFTYVTPLDSGELNATFVGYNHSAPSLALGFGYAKVTLTAHPKKVVIPFGPIFPLD
jgi:hypothetical protein